MDLAELGSLADQLEAVREKRIAADKVAASLKSEETRIKTQIISEMEEKDLSSIGGKSAVLSRITKKRPIANDWSKVYSFIREHDAFDLLHKRLTESAVNLRFDDGVEIPGISLMTYSHITFGKART